MGGAGCDEYFTRLYGENFPDMYYFARKVLGSGELAEDAVQEAFVVAYRKLDVLMASPAPRAWLFRTLRNVVGDCLRRRARLVELLGAEREPEGSAGDPADLRLELECAIDRDSLDMLVRIYAERYSYKEVAGLYGITVDAAKKRVQRAKDRLRGQFRKEGL